MKDWFRLAQARVHNVSAFKARRVWIFDRCRDTCYYEWVTVAPEQEVIDLADSRAMENSATKYRGG